ncbi:virulence plasmid 65kDa B protein-domain-containing protein [Ilyonectria sp. MPI-CAGE-AT-0026]|nr:virulence plasmid 65kDa B protein-domain-containing protein [Ilyonectria sp. MPI-CAGE-AT-0026]
MLPQPGQQRDRNAIKASHNAPAESSSSTSRPAPADPGSGGGSTAASSSATLSVPTLDVSSISTGKGGGALRSIDQKFTVNPSNGTFSLSIPLNVTSGRKGFHPSLSLSYNSGSGNGPFGIGWQLGVQSITRKTSKNIPTYGPDENSFVLSGAEDLIPTENDAGEIHDGYSVHTYRPRVEPAQVLRVERWTSREDPEQVFWKTISGDNFTNIYGRADSSRLFDGVQDGHFQKRIFSWLLCESYDPFGNAIGYTYKAENDDRVDSQQFAWEMNRDTRIRSRARYLKSIKYGNRTPCRDLNTWVVDYKLLQSTEWCYELVFDYGEHEDACLETAETRPWDIRVDPFSSFRSGFEVRLYRLCRRVLMFHHFPRELGKADYLVSSASFTYKESPTGTFVQSVMKNGHVFDEKTQTYNTESLAPLVFEYSQLPEVHSLEIESTKPTCLQTLPVSSERTATRWIDLDGDGSPGLLVQMDGAWYYQRNENAINSRSDTESDSEPEIEADIIDDFGPVRQLREIPNIREFSKHSFEDLDGSGKQNVVVEDENGRTSGYYERLDDDARDWTRLQLFPSILNTTREEGDMKRTDLTGDGLSDLFTTDTNGDIIWHASMGKLGFSQQRRCRPLTQEASPRILVGDDSKVTCLADMCGDGMEDIVQISNGRVSYWPNLGYGRFGKEVVMGNAPIMDSIDLFTFERLQLLDVDGSGTKDILYLRPEGGAVVYYNECGNAWSDGTLIPQFPRIDKLSTVFVVDVLGNGTNCLCWVGPDGSVSDELILHYFNLAAGGKPHLLNSFVNNTGQQTKISYRPSTKFFLRDERAGQPWKTKLPFPVHVVSKVVERDVFSLSSRVRKYAYHDGFFDGQEQEFRGFGMVEVWERDELKLTPDQLKPVKKPVKHTKMWFHTGAPDASLIPQRGIFGSVLVRSILPETPNSFSHQQMMRAISGMQLRSETYGLDGTAKSEIPYSVQDSTYDIDVLQKPRHNNNPGVFRVMTRESLSLTYEREKENPRMKHDLVLARNDYGDVTKSATVWYGCKKSHLDLVQCRELQEAHDLTYSETEYTDAIDETGEFYKPLVASTRESHVSNLHIDGIVDITKARADPRSMFGLVKSYEASVKNPQVTEGNESRIYYRSADLTQCLALGKIEAGPVLVDHTLQLALGEQECEDAYGVDREKLVGYSLHDHMENGRHLYRDGSWWVPSSRVRFAEPEGGSSSVLLTARKCFFTPTIAADPFDNLSVVQLDSSTLLPVKITDALGNISQAVNDYRLLQPTLVTDANGNRTGVGFNAIGDRTAISRMGKEGENVGDTLDSDVPMVVSSETIMAFMKRPSKESAARLLGGWSTRSISWHRTFGDGDRQLPPFQIELVRVEHVHQEVEESVPADIAVKFTYFGVNGNIIQTSTIDSWDGEQPQWCISDCSVYDMDGTVVKSYHPFFSSDHIYKPHLDIEAPAIISFVDALGRQVGILNPDHTWSKTAFTAWSKAESHAGHTLSTVDPTTDLDVGVYFRSLNTDTFLPSWMEMKRRGDQQDQVAVARSADIAAGGPIVSHLDSQQREILRAETLNDKTRTHRSSQYDRLGRLIALENMDAGGEFSVYDCLDQPVLLCDSRGVSKLMKYDELRRPVQILVRPGAGESEYVWSETKYGEGEAEAESGNLRGRAIRVRDQAGSRGTGHYDFKGNPLSTTTQLAAEYKTAIDWSKDVELEPTVYESKASYDAMDRVRLSTDALSRQTHRTYDTSGGLIGLKSRTSEDKSWTAHVVETTYTADGLPSMIKQGNNSTTRYTYGLNTRCILEKKTQRGDGTVLEDHSYTYDILNRVVSTTDSAQQTVFFRNNRITPTKESWYDGWGRLVKAAGREMLSGNGISSSLKASNPGNPLAKMGLSAANGQQLVAYTETYEYDDADNILAMQHQVSDESTPGWRRTYTYEEPSLIDPNTTGNRLSGTKISGCEEKYGYDGPKLEDGMNGAGVVGCITSMPGFSRLGWDCNRKLRSTARQSVKHGVPETTWFVYDSDGNRVRKVTERATLTTGGSNTKLKQKLFLDGAEIFQRYGGDGISFQSTTITSRINGSASGDAPLVMIETEANEQDAPELIRYSLSPSLEVDDQARVVSYEEYSPFGTSTLAACRSEIEAPSSYRFASYRRDSETGFYHCGARYYLPQLGRWASPDPLNTVDGPNTYCYCANDPVNWVDPEGTMYHLSHGIKMRRMEDKAFFNGSGITMNRLQRNTRTPGPELQYVLTVPTIHPQFHADFPC